MIDPLTRRELLGASAGVLWAGCRRLSTAPRVVIVGGGFGGATCARMLRRLAPNLRVTLIERRPSFLTGPFSNMVVAGYRTPESIRFGLEALRAEEIEVRVDAARTIDPVRRRVITKRGDRIEADRLVVAPGVELLPGQIQGLDDLQASMPAAWTGDEDVLRLRAQVRSAPRGAVVVIGAPMNPYRCPPGPYERAGLIAHALRDRRAKIFVCDAKDDFTKRALFRLEWDTRYPNMVEWIPRAQGGQVRAVDAQPLSVRLANGETLRADVASIIPPQRAGRIAIEADLADETGWCPVDGPTFESARHRGVYIIGDAAAASPMPKSAFCANGQAKLAALAIIRSLRGGQAPAEKLVNTCFSLTTPDHAISVSAVYEVGRSDGPPIAMLSNEVSNMMAGEALRRREAEYAHEWFGAITRDSFGVRTSSPK